MVLLSDNWLGTVQILPFISGILDLEDSQAKDWEGQEDHLDNVLVDLDDTQAKILVGHVDKDPVGMENFLDKSREILA